MRIQYEYYLIKQLIQSLEYLIELVAQDPVDDSDAEIINDYHELVSLDYFVEEEHDPWLIYFDDLAKELLLHDKIVSALSAETLYHVMILEVVYVKLVGRD